MLPSCSLSVSRRLMLAAPFLALMSPSRTAATTFLPSFDDHREWSAFKRRFVSPEGRVVDTGNRQVSHTEGQGWGLLLAQAHGDKACFDALDTWTQANMRRGQDRLHAWRWKPDVFPHVDDQNNATDGDLFIAWALARAGASWQRTDLSERSAAIGEAILVNLVRKVGQRHVLLPGAVGFEHGDNVLLNPSYYPFPALRCLGAASSPMWNTLSEDGMGVISASLIGRLALPPDWVSFSASSGVASLSTGHPTRFSYDAIRVPLYLAWDGRTIPALSDALARFWAMPTRPAWIDVVRGDVADYRECEGFTAVRLLATSRPGQPIPRAFPSVDAATDYYSAALIMLARLAWRERPQTA